MQHITTQTFQQRNPLFKTLCEVEFSLHCTLGDFSHLLTYPGGMSEFVDHFGFDQGRIHIEADKATGTSVHIIFLEGDVHIQVVGGFQKLRSHGGLVCFTTHRKLDTSTGCLALFIQRDTARKSTDLVNIEIVLGGNGSHACNCVGLNGPRQQRDDMAGFPLTGDPVLVAFRRHRSERD